MLEAQPQCKVLVKNGSSFLTDFLCNIAKVSFKDFIEIMVGRDFQMVQTNFLVHH